MELFQKARTIRLRTVNDKYLTALGDGESVCQDRNGLARNAIWTVEFVPGGNCVRLKSCYGKYLTASNLPFLPGVTGKKILQTESDGRDGAADWEPLRDGFQVRLRTRTGNFLRPNGGLPPWRNSVTHDVPHRPRTREKLLWDVDVVELLPAAHRRARSETMLNKSRSASSAVTNPSKISRQMKWLLS